MLSLQRFCGWEVGLGAACITMALATAANGQNVIIPDATLGPNESSIVIPLGGALDTIFGGAIRGQNQFHSFEAFNVGQGSGVIFVAGGDEIANILARVTGNDISEIQGFLGTVKLSNGNFDSIDTNLFLLNPNGIVFGENAILGVDGSFYATTAEAIELGDQVFSATNPTQSALLAVDPNTVFSNYLTDSSGNIEVLGRLDVPANLTLAANQLTVQDSDIEVGNALTVLSTNNLSIVNSDVESTSPKGDLLIQGKNILIVDSSIITMGQGELGDIVLIAEETVEILSSDVEAINPIGDFLIQGKNILIADSSIITMGQGELGDIVLIAEETVEILNREGETSLLNTIDGPGTTGNIAIAATNLKVIDRDDQANGADVAIGAWGDNGGNSGNITIDVSETILLDEAILSTFVTGEAPGNAGGIQIMATDLEILNGTQVQATIVPPMGRQNTDNNSNTGDITIDITGNLRLSGFSQVNDVTVFSSSINTDVLNGGRGNAGNLRISADEIELDDSANLSTSVNGSGSAGQVNITANQLTFRNGAGVLSATLGQGTAGNIFLDIAETASFDGTASINSTGLPAATGLFARTLGSGSGGNIELRTNNLNITNGAAISTSTSGAGDAGNIMLDIAETARIDGLERNGLAPSGIETDTNEAATGNGGDLRLSANRLEVTGGAQLGSSLSGIGEAGDILVEAGTVLVQGFDANAIVNNREIARSIITSNIQETGQGQAGNIMITADNLIVADGGIIDAAVLGNGDGGDIHLNISETARIAGVASDSLPSVITNSNDAISEGRAGNLFLRAGSLEVLDGGQISNSIFQTGKAGIIVLDIAGTARFEGRNPITPEFSSGVFSRTESDDSGGNLQIFAQDLDILDGATLNTTSLSEGSSGNIIIDLRGRLTANDGEITTASSAASGGIIDINASAIRLSGDSNIRTDVELGGGRGGNITLRANTILAFDDSDILAFSADGEGGNILLETPVFFGQNLQPTAQLSTRQELIALDGNDRVDVNATGGVASGSINTPDVSNISSSLTELPSNLINAEALIAGSCVARSNDTGGSFVVTGDDLGQQPGQERSSIYSTGVVQTVDDNTVVQLPQEPEAIYPLADGRLVLSQEC
ncbi:MAG: filamentous hemagglutinin N-terminal domain-containing protein [Cyanobacteria bacterium P01_F01_bin.116]